MADTNVIKGKLPLFRSPVSNVSSSRATTFNVREVADQPNLDEFGFRAVQDVRIPGEDTPEFERHDDATTIEVFYDLFFAANLCIFAEVQDVANAQQLGTFVCYFCLLWFTWAILGLFDVRFVTDSIFERCVRAIHFGAMVGFAVVAPNFNLFKQDDRTMRTMSIILMTSRLALASQYGSIMWHVRKFKTTWAPFGIMLVLNLVAAVIYLGVAFGFKETGTEALWVVWFVVTAVEITISVWASLRWDVLSFQGTHLTNRVSLLTFILMGEGIVTVCSAVTKIVLNTNQWTSPTIGNVAAGVANIYIIYMIYMDWRRAKSFPRGKQLVWSFLHLPFHLALKLFLLASSQFVIWWKIFETIYQVGDQLFAAVARADDPTFWMSSDWLVEQFEAVLNDVFATYQPKYMYTIESINHAMDELRKIPDDYWNLEPGRMTPADEQLNQQVLANIETMSSAVANSLLATFNINGYAGVTDNFVGKGNDTFAAVESTVEEANWNKFHTVFIAAFAGAGFTVIVLNIMFIVSRSTPLSTFNYIRKAINFLIGIGLCLVPLITLNEEKSQIFTMTPWPLPTLVMALFFILILNHLPHPPPIFFNGRVKSEKQNVPLQTWETNQNTESAAASLVAYNENNDRKSGYQNVSIHDQDVETGYQGAGAHDTQRYGS